MVDGRQLAPTTDSVADISTSPTGGGPPRFRSQPIRIALGVDDGNRADQLAKGLTHRRPNPEDIPF